jgi:glyoxylase-like metal-dependent hydrolase (beta-lactamase superfamily II)
MEAKRQLGDLTVRLVGDGHFKLDGGAMFGVVPRTLWSREKTPDAEGRIRMATNCLLVERGAELLLIDSGLGDHHDAKFRAIYDFEQGAIRLPDQIKAAGYELGDVTHVVLSHLHFDHCGWNCTERGGALVPTFPKARYWMNKGEVEHARAPNLRDRASYNPRNWEPLIAAGVAELFDEQVEPMPGVEAIKVSGHNRDMCIVRVDGGAADAQLVFWADLVPTTAHVPYPWIMGYDLYPLETLDHKLSWLPRAVDGNWLCVFEHDAETPWARLREERPGKLRVVPA